VSEMVSSHGSVEVFGTTEKSAFMRLCSKWLAVMGRSFAKLPENPNRRRFVLIKPELCGPLL
jgi:hypothetical protein